MVTHGLAPVFGVTMAKQLKSIDQPFQLRVLAHNLDFYAAWMTRLRHAIHNKSGIDFCRLHFPRRLFARCAAELVWEVPA